MSRFKNNVVLILSVFLILAISLFSCPTGAVTTTPTEPEVKVPIYTNLTGSGVYFSQGTTTVESATNLGGADCTLFTGDTVDGNGSICVEVQYSLTAATDFTNGYTVSFDLWVVDTSDDLSYAQASVWSTGYKPAYINGPDVSPKGQWNTFSKVFGSDAEYGYSDSAFDITTVELIRMKVVTAAAGDSVAFAIKNIVVTPL